MKPNQQEKKDSSQQARVHELATKLLGWNLRVGHDGAYYEADEKPLTPVEEFQPYKRLHDAHIIWASLVMDGWIVSACWGPIEECTIMMARPEDFRDRDKMRVRFRIEAKSNNLCEAICKAALKVIE